MNVGTRIAELMQTRKLSQNKLAKRAGISQSGLSSIISGAVSPKESTLTMIAAALGCSVAQLISDGEDWGYTPPDAIPLTKGALPIVGDIACGTPITAEQNIEGFADLPEGVRADFALRCKGDSMNPLFLDGDLVLIRQQPEVEPGQIAAVMIDGEATLKHVYPQNGGLLLTAENPKFPPIFVPSDAVGEIVIHGRAIGYTRVFD